MNAVRKGLKVFPVKADKSALPEVSLNQSSQGLFDWKIRLAEVLGPVSLFPVESPLSVIGGPPNSQDAF
jgi:hypothetical protein